MRSAILTRADFFDTELAQQDLQALALIALKYEIVSAGRSSTAKLLLEPLEPLAKFARPKPSFSTTVTSLPPWRLALESDDGPIGNGTTAVARGLHSP